VDAVILISSILVNENESEDVLKKKVDQILSSTGSIPLGIYECPMPYKRLLSVEMMKWLADTGRFLCHKDTCCNSASIKTKIDAVRGSRLKIYDAHTPNAYTSMQDGAAGLTPISANFFQSFMCIFLNCSS
jgi:4-hydroxy-tetrahydrodipicolinate synthase